MLTSEDSFVCAICLNFESETTPDWFVTTPAGHVFHSSCVTSWLNRGSNRCPLCNETLFVKRLTRLFGIDPSSRRDSQGSSCSGDDETSTSEAEVNNNDISTDRDPDYSLKIVLLGDAGVGKSCMLYRYTTGVFNYTITSTVGCDVSFRTIECGGKLIKLSVWDSGGQERFKSISKNFVRNAHGVLLVYSYANNENESQSLSSIPGWIDFIKENGIPGAGMMLVGNKMDIPESERVISTKQGQELARSLGLPFFETSAKDYNNIDAAFRALAVDVVERIEGNILNYRTSSEQRLNLSSDSENQTTKKWCC